MRPSAVAAAVAVVLAVAAPGRAEVVWSGDFETGDKSQWSRAQEVSADRMTVITSPVRQGGYALRVEVRQGDDPIDSSGNRAELVWTEPEVEGNERWYAWSTLWPDDYPSADTWQLFTQWHHSGNSGSPPVEFYVRGEELRLRLNASTVVWTAPLTRGVWHDFLFHVKWSSDPAEGFVELWYDGELVLPLTYGANMFAGQDNYLKQGLYRNEIISEVGVLFHDGMTAGTTREDVAPPPAPTAPDGGPPPDAGVPPPPPSSPDAGGAPVDEDEDGAGLAGGCRIGQGRVPGGAVLVLAFLVGILGRAITPPPSRGPGSGRR